MFEKLTKRLTNNYNEIPLFYVNFNLNHFLKEGAKGSCVANLHPSLKNDEYIRKQLNDLIDYIRDNHDMEELIK
ncbi:hypothetical protein [Bacillus vallismortis]|uniref:hypothetical protein n=1 Tax=Bacillus vallismortis TaxID=72361 RepID=UPI002280177B|nr:hypothetical protein [Bacillus vallismortis]MCY8546630.1 hypothetical protein [Bacillus vallismortis]